MTCANRESGKGEKNSSHLPAHISRRQASGRQTAELSSRVSNTVLCFMARRHHRGAEGRDWVFGFFPLARRDRSRPLCCVVQTRGHSCNGTCPRCVETEEEISRAWKMALWSMISSPCGGGVGVWSSGAGLIAEINWRSVVS